MQWNKAEEETAHRQLPPTLTHRKNCTLLFIDGTNLPSFHLLNKDPRVPAFQQPYSGAQSRVEISFLRP